MSRGPISIFGPIFEGEDRSRRSRPKRTWTGLVEKVGRVAGSSFFRLRRSMMGGSSIFWPGRSKMKGIYSICRGVLFFVADDRRCGRFFVLRSRRLNIGFLFAEPNTIFEEPPLSSKNPHSLHRRDPHFRSSAPMVEEPYLRSWSPQMKSPVFDLWISRTKNLPPSIF